MGDWTYDKQREARASKPQHWYRKAEQGRTKPVHECVFDTVRFLDQHQGYKSQDNLRRVRLYGNLPIFGLSPTTFTASDPLRRGRVRINVGRSVIDTATAMIAKQRPRPMVMTDGANYRLQRHAKQLSKFVLGVLQQNKAYKKGPVVFRDGALTGTGCFKAGIDWGRKQIRVERVFIEEILFDDAEAANGMPCQIFHRQFLARDKVLELWGTDENGKDNELAAKIRSAEEARPDSGMAAHKNLADHLQVVESWKLPSGPSMQDGRHAITIGNATLLDEEYEEDCFPLVFFTYGDPVMGLLGMSLLDQLTGIQVSLNKHVDSMEEELGTAASRILVPSNGGIPKSHWVNRIGQVLTYQAGSQPPMVLNPDMVPPGKREQIIFLIQQGYEIAGVSQLNATAKKPAGLNSGAALREYDDIQSERFAVVQAAYEDTFVDLARLIIRLAQQLYSEHKDLEVTVRNKRFIESVKFGEIDIEDHQYELSIFPSSMLPKTPAARFAQIDEWVQAGYITKEEAMRLMDMPDLEDATSLITAAIDDIDETIDHMIYAMPDDEDLDDIGAEEGTAEWEMAVADMVYMPPESMQNLQLGIKRMTAAYLRSKHDGTPEARRMLLDRWIGDAKAMMDEMAAQQAQTMPAPGPGIPVPGGPPPGMEGMPPPGGPMPPGAPPSPPVMQ